MSPALVCSTAPRAAGGCAKSSPYASAGGAAGGCAFCTLSANARPASWTSASCIEMRASGSASCARVAYAAASAGTLAVSPASPSAPATADANSIELSASAGRSSSIAARVLSAPSASAAATRTGGGWSGFRRGSISGSASFSPSCGSAWSVATCVYTDGSCSMPRAFPWPSRPRAASAFTHAPRVAASGSRRWDSSESIAISRHTLSARAQAKRSAIVVAAVTRTYGCSCESERVSARSV